MTNCDLSSRRNAMNYRFLRSSGIVHPIFKVKTGLLKGFGICYGSARAKFSPRERSWLELADTFRGP